MKVFNLFYIESKNSKVVYYIYNGSELLGFVYKNKTYYYHKNISGDIIGILDANYNEIVTYEYDSWGALINITDNSNINLGTINPFRYRSYYYDEETELYYLNSRYYNPKVGRFINADGYVATGQGFTCNNMYCYCNNNYPNMKDYDGKFGWLAVVVVVGCLLLSGCEKKKEPPKDYRDEKSKNINCYAYAFDLDSATNPGSIARKNGYKGMIYEDKYVNTVEETASYVLADMAALDKQVRIVENIDDAKENEYIVALKVGNVRLAEAGGYAAYHFAVLLSDGTWADKPGSTPFRWNKIDGTAAVWDAGMNKEYYNSSSIFFAVEK